MVMSKKSWARRRSNGNTDPLPLLSKARVRSSTSGAAARAQGGLGYGIQLPARATTGYLRRYNNTPRDGAILILEFPRMRGDGPTIGTGTGYYCLGTFGRFLLWH